MPGCAITDITEETLLKGRKIFSFWIVWPHDKNNKSQTPGEDEMLQQPGEESDDEGGISNAGDNASLQDNL